ncbi:hypothetical protein [Novosphingobium sp. JCM 18896]|uniref:hypothetical protein n=1 Tax=Novosphingobium sp. JCM 18896 TaxID=2989731 RepID=UPI0022236F01|nr:hypothetical protein [Novosphingobium sp. JCM 18896]MCW1431594.1 hypothetical protein [Novosphingobium sp. JCM 18896]
MGSRAKTIALGAVSALALASSPAAAQVIFPDGSSTPITDIQIADNPQSFLDDEVLKEALRKSLDIEVVSRSDVQKADTRAAVRAAFDQSAEDIIATFNLTQVPGLQFQTAGNKSAVEQDGSRNLARIDQTAGNRGWAIVNQNGEDGSATVRQADTGAPFQESLNRVYIGQVGYATPTGSNLYSNTAEVNQTHRSFDLSSQAFNGTNAVNNATIQQGGMRNFNFSSVNVPTTGVGEQNRARIDQLGAGNDGVIQQGLDNATTFAAETGDTVGSFNSAILYQEGFGNRGAILQEDYAIAITRQVGSNNEAYVRQDGDVLDSGSFSEIDQGSLDGGDADDNFAVVYQRGMAQESTIRQLSNNNTAYVYQAPGSAYAKSTIEQKGGVGNYVSVLQSAAVGTEGLAVISAILQNGSGNEAFVSQTVVAGSVSNVTQTGNGNFANVRQ